MIDTLWPAAQRESAQDYSYNATCMDQLRGHIKRELEASITYLAMVRPLIQVQRASFAYPSSHL